MPSLVVVGAQWGDEAKGKITDVLARNADLVVRYAGGSNAGHTVQTDLGTFKFHLMPSGILNPRAISIISDGVVVDPAILVSEIDELRHRKTPIGELRLSGSCHVVMPYHRLIDRLDEEERGGRKIGTTCQGVGPAYTDKVRRIGIRMADFVDEDALPAALHQSLEYNNRIIERIYGGAPLDEQEVLREYQALAKRLKPYVCDTAWLVGEALHARRRVLFEGAQGTLLDIDYGTYPYVTSSHPVSGGACLGTGAGPTSVTGVIGVIKAYTSRVGEGVFLTELKDATGEGIRKRGNEYGTTTGRPRRVGWLDAVALRFALMVNGIDALAITLMDVLTGMRELRICRSYRTPAGEFDRLPLRGGDLVHCEPVYETFPGWSESLRDVRHYEDLPHAARQYVEGVSRLVGAPVGLVSVGPHRDQTVPGTTAIDELWDRSTGPGSLALH